MNSVSRPTAAAVGRPPNQACRASGLSIHSAAAVSGGDIGTPWGLAAWIALPAVCAYREPGTITGLDRNAHPCHAIPLCAVSVFSAGRWARLFWALH